MNRVYTIMWRQWKESPQKPAQCSTLVFPFFFFISHNLCVHSDLAVMRQWSSQISPSILLFPPPLSFSLSHELCVNTHFAAVISEPTDTRAVFFSFFFPILLFLLFSLFSIVLFLACFSPLTNLYVHSYVAAVIAELTDARAGCPVVSCRKVLWTLNVSDCCALPNMCIYCARMYIYMVRV